MKVWISYLCILLLASLCLLCACKSVAPQQKVQDSMTESRALVRKNIADPATSAELMGLVDKMETALQAYADQHRETGEALTRMNADYGASREDMQKVYDEHNRHMREIEEQLLQLQLDIRSLVTPEEWANIR